MVSSALTGRRGPLRRPKVCHESGNVRASDVTHPPGRMVCSITPPAIELPVFEWFLFELAACDTGSEDASPIAVLTDPAGATFSPLFGLENCNQIPAEFMATVPGVYNITAEFTALSARICIATATVIVNP